MHQIKWKPLIICLLIPLAVGGLSALLTMGSMEVYGNLNQPPLSPPGFLFPIVWTILFILMGISSYLIFVSDDRNKTKALIIYAVQLVFNFVWSLIFFNMQSYLFAFIWLVILWALIIAMIVSFWKISKPAALLQIPYLLWVTFAGYLNLGVYLLNR